MHQEAGMSAGAQVLSPFPLFILSGTPARDGVTHIQGESSLFSYTSLATASQVHSEVRLLSDSKPSQIGNGD